MKLMEKTTLSTQLFNVIVQYLGTQPYQQVFQIIDAIQKELSPKNQGKIEE